MRDLANEKKKPETHLKQFETSGLENFHQNSTAFKKELSYPGNSRRILTNGLFPLRHYKKKHLSSLDETL